MAISLSYIPPVGAVEGAPHLDAVVVRAELVAARGSEVAAVGREGQAGAAEAARVQLCAQGVGHAAQLAGRACRQWLAHLLKPRVWMLRSRLKLVLDVKEPIETRIECQCQGAD